MNLHVRLTIRREGDATCSTVLQRVERELAELRSAVRALSQDKPTIDAIGFAMPQAFDPDEEE